MKNVWRSSLSLTLSMCGCVWWAVGWATPRAEVVSSLSPKPDSPPSEKGRRAAVGSEGRWAAAVGLLVRRDQGLTSWVGHRLRFVVFFFCVFSVSDLLQCCTKKKRKEGHTSCMAWVWGRVRLRSKGGLQVEEWSRNYLWIRRRRGLGKMADEEKQREIFFRLNSRFDGSSNGQFSNFHLCFSAIT